MARVLGIDIYKVEIGKKVKIKIYTLFEESAIIFDIVKG